MIVFSIYCLFCVGGMIGHVNAIDYHILIKIMFVILSPILCPLFFGIRIGILLFQ